MTIEQELTRMDTICMWIAIVVVGTLLVSLAIRAIWDWWSVKMYLRENHKMCQKAIEYNRAVDRGEKPGPYKSVCIGGRRY